MIIRPIFSLIVLPITLTVAALDVTVYTQDANCGGNNGSATAFVDTLSGGGPPFVYEWGPGTINGQGTFQVTDLAPGEYYVTVTDGDGTNVTENFSITGQPGLFLDGTIIQTTVSCFEDCAGGYYASNSQFGGTGPYSATIDPPGPVVTTNFSGISVSGMCAGGPHTITVVDSQGCSAVIQITEVIEVEPLQLLQQTITASCPDGATGTLQLLFDRPVWLFDHNTWENLSDDSVAFHDLSGLPPGDIEIFAMGGGPACIDSMTFTISIPSSTDDCGTISGTVYADLNGDCMLQPGESGLPFRTLAITPEPEDLVITDANGNYSRDRNLGSHELHFSMPDFAPVCPSSLPFSFDLTASDPIVQQDIAMQYMYTGPDAYVHITAFPPRIADTTNIWVTVTNNSPYAVPAAELHFTHSALQTYVSASIAPLSISSGSLTWQMDEIAPFTTWQVNFRIDLPIDVTLIGQSVDYQAQIVQGVPDANPANDIHQLTDLIVGAYDPNDKLASTGSGAEYYDLYYDEYVDYTIRFQNTGNAEAEHVFIIDTISDLFDARSLEILGASHAYEVEWLGDRSIRFDFPQIMLPDSGSDQLGSQGFVSFRLNPIQSISDGDTLANTADIFFDFNPPIRTNTHQLMVIGPFSIEENAATMIGAYPNPTSDQITIEATDQFKWTITSLDGKIVLSGRNTAQQRSIDVSSLAKGQYVLQVIGSDRTGYAKFIKQ